MRRELRGGDFFGVRPNPAKIKELIDEVALRFGEAVETQLSTVEANYRAEAQNLDDLIDELDSSARFINNLHVTIKAVANDHAVVHLTFGEQPSRWRFRLGLFPYRSASVTYWSVTHPDGITADRIAREIHHRLREMGQKGWRYKSGIWKWNVVAFLPFAFGAFACLFPSPQHSNPQTYIAGVVMLLIFWLNLPAQFEPVKIQVRPPAILRAWSSWHPSSATVARTTVIATVLAVPALLLALVQVFQG
ncbi:hypothetical protein OG342_32225 [Streptomyces bobili]|uniref:hypothetical protein n=1 Tax=Streptomyces bobili TaxID=67280 RepID=UPI00225C2D26|nr:hypothetical protein [Streptomyces bobili]MCX5527470.1 hypothetical protein [Streptomyces bobili]